MHKIKFLILEKTFENFLRRNFRRLKEIENEIFEENVINCLRKKFYQEDSRNYQPVINGHIRSQMVTYDHIWSQKMLVLVIYSGHTLS